MSHRVNFSRRNLLTARDTRSTVTDAEQSFRLDLSNRCLTFDNVVCEACRDNCEVDAIRFPPKLGAAARPVIDADRCTGCGDCIDACPTKALSLETIGNIDAVNDSQHD